MYVSSLCPCFHLWSPFLPYNSLRLDIWDFHIPSYQKLISLSYSRLLPQLFCVYIVWDASCAGSFFLGYTCPLRCCGKFDFQVDSCHNSDQVNVTQPLLLETQGCRSHCVPFRVLSLLTRTASSPPSQLFSRPSNLHPAVDTKISDKSLRSSISLHAWQYFFVHFLTSFLRHSSLLSLSVLPFSAAGWWTCISSSC